MANISGMDENIQNRKSIKSTAIPVAFSEKSPVNLGCRKFGGLEVK